MAQLPGTFNPDEHEDQGDFDVLPAGNYLAQVIESEITPTKDGSGEILKLTFEVMDGPYERRRIWARLNIVNRSPDAQRIAQAQLAGLCKAAGLGPIDDTDALHFKPVIVVVKVRNDPQYGAQNDVRGFKAAGNSAPPVRPQTQRGAGQAPQSAPGQGFRESPQSASAHQANSRPTATGGRPWGQRASA